MLKKKYARMIILLQRMILNWKKTRWTHKKLMTSNYSQEKRRYLFGIFMCLNFCVVLFSQPRKIDAENSNETQEGKKPTNNTYWARVEFQTVNCIAKNLNCLLNWGFLFGGKNDNKLQNWRAYKMAFIFSYR